MATPPLPRGITLLDLITQIPPAAAGLIPDKIAGFLERLSISDLSHRTSGFSYIHEGTVSSVADMGLRLPEGFELELPGITEGLRFEYCLTRAAATAGTALEGSPTAWTLHIYLDRVMIPLPLLRAAVRGVTVDGWVGPLTRDPERERVHIWMRATLRFANGSALPTLVADPDPFLPANPSGTVIRGGFEPRHMLFHESGFGLTVGDVLLDASPVYTPPQIQARGHDATWTGLDVAEATLYLPRDVPFIGDITVGVRDLLLGFGGNNGIQLEAVVQLGHPGRHSQSDLYHQRRGVAEHVAA